MFLLADGGIAHKSVSGPVRLAVFAGIRGRRTRGLGRSEKQGRLKIVCLFTPSRARATELNYASEMCRVRAFLAHYRAPGTAGALRITQFGHEHS